MTAVFVQGENYRSFGTNLSTTAETTIYTCPTGMQAARVVWVHAADDGGASTTISVTFTDSSASASYIMVVGEVIAANTAYDKDFALAMDPGDTLKATAGNAGLHVIVTAHEVTGRRA